MKEERILSEEEVNELFEISIEKGIDIFSNIWNEFKDTEEFDIETLVASVMTECVIFLRMREWTKKEIRENVTIGIDVADDTRKEMKREEENA
jgi:predicted XRE-type DNA-binding protein